MAPSTTSSWSARMHLAHKMHLPKSLSINGLTSSMTARWWILWNGTSPIPRPISWELSGPQETQRQPPSSKRGVFGPGTERNPGQPQPPGWDRATGPTPVCILPVASLGQCNLPNAESSPIVIAYQKTMVFCYCTAQSRETSLTSTFCDRNPEKKTEERAKARRFYHSLEYREVKRLRNGAATTPSFAVEDV